MADLTLNYRVAGLTVRRFHQSPAFVKAVMGPIGSGKSTGCVMEILIRAAQQAPGPDGIRRTRWAVIRNTYGELRTTTIKTWEQWCPLDLGKLSWDAPIAHRIQRPGVDIEVLFLALDREDDMRKLLSLELTGAWINEAREVPKSILDTLTGRVGRFPARRDGGATWSGVLLDTNPPDNESWYYRLAEEETPEGWEFFKQPGGESPDAENLDNLPAGYYQRIKAGKSDDWIKVYVEGQYGFVIDGKPVYPSYRDTVHVAAERLAADKRLPLLFGADFGLTPAAAIGQRAADGRWLIVDEFVCNDTGAVRFAESLAAYVAQKYPGFVCEGWADPAGTARVQTDEKTCIAIMKEYTAWNWHPAPDNGLQIRLESVRGALNRLVDGRPGLLLSPNCMMLRKGFAGSYQFKPVRTGNGTQFHEVPTKNEYSHIADALQYLLSGGGEAAVVMRKIQRSTPGNRPQYAESGPVYEYEDAR